MSISPISGPQGARPVAPRGASSPMITPAPVKQFIPPSIEVVLSTTLRPDPAALRELVSPPEGVNDAPTVEAPPSRSEPES